MSKSSRKLNRPIVDLIGYAARVLSAEDRPLFDDAVAAGNAGALRAAYVMIWLSCAESLKRRFREAQKRDGAAGKIVGAIETKEREHKAVDNFVLDKAREYGFVSDTDHTILNHIYEMRCLYGHPYEEAPSQEQVSHAAAAVVEHVLSKPVKLRHGFGEQLLKSLLNEPAFLDDQQTTVAAFVTDILPRLDESIHGWLLDNYWDELEKLADDSSMSLFFRRGIWFSRAMLMEVGVDVFSRDHWHDRTSKFSKVLMRVCSTVAVFNKIGERAQDSLVGLILAESGTRASVLTHLECLNNNGALTERQQDRFVEHVSVLEMHTIRSSGLSTLTCYGRLIKAMKSYDWHLQNPAVDLVVWNGPVQATELDEDRQVNLGRNILQCAEGGAWSASSFLKELSKDGSSWPFNVLRGIALESFTNENNQIRFKSRHLDQLISALNQLEKKHREQVISELAASVTKGALQSWVMRNQIAKAIDLLKDCPGAVPLVAALEARADELPD